MNENQSFTHTQKMALLVVGLAVFTDMLIYGLIVPILPGYAVSLGASQSAIGLLFGSYALALFIATPLMGLLSDRFGRRRPMLWGLLVLAASTLLFGFSQSFLLLVVARVLQGVAAAATWTAGLALLADLFSPEERGKVLGLALSGQAAGTLLGPAIGGWLFELGGYQLPFIFATALALIDGVLRILLLAEPPQRLTEKKLPIGRLLRFRPLLIISGVILLGAAIPSVLEPTLPLFLQDQLHIKPGIIGTLFAIPTLSFGLSTPIIGGLSSRFGRFKTMIVGLFVSGICLPLITMVHSCSGEIAVLALLGVGLGLLLAPSMPELADIADKITAGNYGLIFAIYNTVYSVGMFVGPILGGTLADQLGLPRALLIIAACAVLYSIALLTMGTLSTHSEIDLTDS